MKLEDRGDVFVTAVLGGLAVLFVVFALWLQWFWAGTSMDIDVYWEAGQRMLHGGRNLYAESEDGTNQVGLFIYPPLFATLFAPITLLPRWAGYALWGLLELLLMAAGLRAARGLCDVPAGRQARLFYLLMIAGLFGALWTNLQEGQVNMLVVSALLAGAWLIERDKPLRGGLLLAAATHLKVIPVVLLPILLAQKRFKAAAGMTAGLLLLWAAPLLYSVPNHGVVDGVKANVSLHGDYLDSIVKPRLEAGNASGLGGSRAPNNSLTAVARRWFSDDHRLSLQSEGRSPLLTELPDGVVRYGALGLAALLGGLSMLLAWRCRNSRLARSAVLGLALLSAALANLLFWPHHLCLLLLVLAPLAAWCLRANDLRPMYAALGAALLLCYLPLIDTVPLFDHMAIWGTPTLGVLLIWAGVFFHFWRRKGTVPAVGDCLRRQAAADAFHNGDCPSAQAPGTVP